MVMQFTYFVLAAPWDDSGDRFDTLDRALSHIRMLVREADAVPEEVRLYQQVPIRVTKTVTVQVDVG
jgi:hypothetical protein